MQNKYIVHSAHADPEATLWFNVYGILFRPGCQMIIQRLSNFVSIVFNKITLRWLSTLLTLPFLCSGTPNPTDQLSEKIPVFKNNCINRAYRVLTLWSGFYFFSNLCCLIDLKTSSCEITTLSSLDIILKFTSIITLVDY